MDEGSPRAYFLRFRLAPKWSLNFTSPQGEAPGTNISQASSILGSTRPSPAPAGIFPPWIQIFLAPLSFIGHPSERKISSFPTPLKLGISPASVINTASFLTPKASESTRANPVPLPLCSTNTKPPPRHRPPWLRGQLRRRASSQSPGLIHPGPSGGRECGDIFRLRHQSSVGSSPE